MSRPNGDRGRADRKRKAHQRPGRRSLTVLPITNHIANRKTCEAPSLLWRVTEVLMKTEQARIPITDFIKVWCELCRIRIDAREERTDVGGKTYHPDCYSTLFAAAPKPTGQSIRAGFQS